MGSSTTAVSVPHKVEDVAYHNPGRHLATGWELAITGQSGHGLPVIPNKMGPGGSHDPNFVDGVDLGHGWQFIPSCVGYTRHNDILYCDEIIHEERGFTIFVVNESPYAAGGEQSMSIFADTREPLEAFLKDKDPDKLLTILDVAAIQQTL